MQKPMIGYVDESIFTDCVLVLLIKGFDVHDCVANSQSLVSQIPCQNHKSVLPFVDVQLVTISLNTLYESVY